MHTWRKPQGRWSVDALMAVIVNCDTRNVILLRCTVQLCNTSVAARVTLLLVYRILLAHPCETVCVQGANRMQCRYPFMKAPRAYPLRVRLAGD